MKKLTFNNYRTLIRLCSTHASESKPKLNFFLCVERQPVITRSLNEIEEKFRQTLIDIENTNSLKSDFELQKEKEKKQLKITEDLDTEELVSKFKNTIQDLEERYRKELESLNLAPRSTPEINKNLFSVERKLDKSIFLVKKQVNKKGKEIWLPPYDSVKEGETIKQAVRRFVDECCGKDSKTVIYSTVPVAYLKNKNENSFCFLVRYLKGPDSLNKEHQWLDREEIKKVLPLFVYKNIKHLLKTSA